MKTLSKLQIPILLAMIAMTSCTSTRGQQESADIPEKPAAAEVAVVSDEVQAPLPESLRGDTGKDQQWAESTSMWRPIGSIIIVLGVLGLVGAWLRKRMPGTAQGDGRKMKIIEKLSIDYKRSILLVEADGRRLVIGVTPERIDCLTDLGSSAADGQS